MHRNIHNLVSVQLTQSFPILLALLHCSTMTPAQERRQLQSSSTDNQHRTLIKQLKYCCSLAEAGAGEPEKVILTLQLSYLVLQETKW